MELSQEDRKADKEIADVVNELESLQLKEFSKENDKATQGLIVKLNSFPRKYNDRVKANWDEIIDCLRGLTEWYNAHNLPSPILNPMYFMQLCYT